MLKFMTGTPGSGKSYHMACKIQQLLRIRKNVISTVDINLDIVSKRGRRKIGVFKYKSLYDLTPEFFYRFAYDNHERGKESQTVVFVDECQNIFNSRDFQAKDRREWLRFFTSHRHYGYDFYLVTQNDRMVDRQIRALVEYEIKHRCANRLLWFLPITYFVVIETWYGHTTKPKIYSQWIRMRKEVFKLYDSYAMFDELEYRFGYSGKSSEVSTAALSENPFHEDAPPEIKPSASSSRRSSLSVLFGLVQNGLRLIDSLIKSSLAPSKIK